ncbi:class IIb bacteriocin, lactobin A/cerein 7B family [Streptococcus ruminantium]|uniref:Class IIb bacteriocin, lactobin A/cerein 7B family n=1 Tax=Streptococcus ruminantium TaxID=1917441 RepID=A0ABU1B2R5_9STRE|nr:class IIb bacteriocin, lactobin A/cerein 7B family [Streptococcus ruminantium]MDQ8759567.1 class IIb bacteriocin, lactobin A/cerein 7B family [Streptococcus ruminantium]MDQ8764468.1 class IIb bacteriocin, lactobin A/cerein 7B family [Streptococcus ruminantium]MDQ8768594.1 class IIb bacteriocin, lactobin A/cerein 7B family [Streptococcus ruminantium]MDQ8775031.1 class IIb bacteriocin, lactobin A/cerein 7B family [Streptococcus ruminantium]MDQ8793963.1 class IIb bacteriocin, lactobin A/cerein
MTTLEALENNYVTLTEAELMDTEGGIDSVIAAFGVIAFKGFSVTGGAIILGTSLYKAGQGLK